MVDREYVVAHYREDLTWTKSLPPGKVTVYCKDDRRRTATSDNQCLPNIGREAHTYLHHIFSRYDQLAGQTVFLQGNPFDHIDSETFRDIPADNEFLELGESIGLDDTTGAPSHSNLDLASRYEELFNDRSPAYFAYRAGANFCVSREVIQRHSQADYRSFLNILLNSPSGPWEFERLWPSIFSPLEPCEGIVTACDAGFFQESRWMLLSLRKQTSRPVEVFDLGLTARQREWVEGLGNCRIVKLPRLINRMSRILSSPMWQTWLKPLYLLASRFDRCLWIDGDCFVLDDLEHAFEQIRVGPLFCPDTTNAPNENRPKLYEWLPAGHDPLSRSVRVNAGVVGLDKFRDRELLAAWAWCVQFAARNLRLLNLFRWWDQGALVWAMHRLEQEHLVSSENQLSVACPPKENPVKQSLCTGQSMTEFLHSRFPDSSLVHFLGVRKLSKLIADCIRL